MNPLDAIGKRVTFKYPPLKPKGPKRVIVGTLLDRHVLSSNSLSGYGNYINTIDRIQFGEMICLRFGYYRNNGWAGQTALTEEFDTMKDLFIKAAREKPWFRDFLEGVMNELNR